MRPSFGRPEEYIWQYISVPPVCIRPSVAQDGASNEDDLTVKLTEIVFSSALIKQGLMKGAPTQHFMVRIYNRSAESMKKFTAQTNRNNGTFFNSVLLFILTPNCPVCHLKCPRNLFEAFVSVSKGNKADSAVTSQENELISLAAQSSPPILTYA